MNASDPVDVTEAAKSKALSHDVTMSEKHNQELTIEPAPAQPASIRDAEDESLQKIYPTDEDLRTLRRVSGKLPWLTFTVAIVELCERFSYYGTTAVCKCHPGLSLLFQKLIERSCQLHPAPASRRLDYRRPCSRL